MSKHFVQNASLRATMLAGYRVWARLQFWRTGPRIFVNSLPKAGTHLLTAELARFAGLRNSGLHLEASRLGVAGATTADGYPVIDPRKVASAIRTVRGGQFFSAHLYWSQELEEAIFESGAATLFMIRDPRDILLSRMHYILGLRRHRLHDFLGRRFATDDDRLRVLVVGNAADPYIRPMRADLASFARWIGRPGVLTVRFEELVGQRGGGSESAKHAALAAIANHCGLDPSGLADQAASSAGATPTLRKGKIGGWRSELPSEIVELVDRECGDLLETMGYRPD